jgi:hypothetical protein
MNALEPATSKLWTPRGRHAPRVECAPLGSGLGFARGSREFGGLSNPLGISGCVDWHRADLGITLSAGSVVTWADQSGTGDPNKDLDGTGHPPPYTANDGAYNGRPTLTFDDIPMVVGPFWMISGNWSTPVAAPHTTFLVCNDDGDTGTQRVFLDNNGAAGGVESAIINVGVDPYLTAWGGAYLETTIAPSTTPKVITFVEDSPTSAVYVSSNTPAATGNSGGVGRYGLTIGGYFAPGFYMKGKIAEIIIYSRALSAPEIAEVHAYLGTRYGITIS